MSKKRRISWFGILLLTGWFGAAVNAQREIPDEFRIGGLAVGTQAYSFHRFTLFEAIEMTDLAGGRVIELYPGQRLSPEQPEVRFSHNSPDDVVEMVQEKLKRHNILAVNYGVVGLPNNEEESRKVFEFARKMGLRAVTSEASAEAMNLIEKLVKEFDIMMGIHNHPIRPNDPGYRHWDPEYILSLVEGRDKRLGACVDTGHYARSGIKPVEVVRLFEGRVISLHLKDIEPFDRSGVDVPFGTGQSDIPAILDELKRQNFQGNISIEYENNLNHNVPDVAQCVGFIRGYTAHWNQ
jgi:sugar phosphate isomerase/epimerase